MDIHKQELMCGQAAMDKLDPLAKEIIDLIGASLTLFYPSHPSDWGNEIPQRRGEILGQFEQEVPGCRCHRGIGAKHSQRVGLKADKSHVPEIFPLTRPPPIFVAPCN